MDNSVGLNVHNGPLFDFRVLPWYLRPLKSLVYFISSSVKQNPGLVFFLVIFNALKMLVWVLAWTLARSFSFNTSSQSMLTLQMKCHNAVLKESEAHLHSQM